MPLEIGAPQSPASGTNGSGWLMVNVMMIIITMTTMMIMMTIMMIIMMELIPSPIPAAGQNNVVG